jgi:arginyl-tRNA synthetase
MNILQTLEQNFRAFIAQTFGKPESLEHITFNLNTDPKKADFGDISSNAAMILAKKLGKNPREIAQHIATTFNDAGIQKIEIAGPGFINIYLTPACLTSLAQELYNNPQSFFKPAQSMAQQYSVEFVSANPTGPLHIGHGRGGIIGDVLGNVLSFVGNPVTKEFYINDAGNQIQKLGESLKVRYMQALGMGAELPEDGYHGEYLKELAPLFIKQFGENAASQPAEIFGNFGKEHLLAALQKTLSDYGIHFDVWFSEKVLHTSGAVEEAIHELTQRGHTYIQDNALWFRATTFGDDKDRVLKRSNGEFTYIAADVAYLQNKLRRGFNKIIMVLGQDHHSYVVRLKAIMQALGNNPDDITVILYQLVTVKEDNLPVRLSKRAGKIIGLQDIIETVGKDVARFFYLNRKADAHLDFDIALALKNTDENPVFYIQYAYVRINSIVKKAREVTDLGNFTAPDLAHCGQPEFQLLKKMASLSEVLLDISRSHQTHALTYYTLELAKEFHAYYSKYKVMDPTDVAQTKARLATISMVHTTIGLCLELLGLSKPESM